MALLWRRYKGGISEGFDDELFVVCSLLFVVCGLLLISLWRGRAGQVFRRLLLPVVQCKCGHAFRQWLAGVE